MQGSKSLEGPEPALEGEFFRALMAAKGLASSSTSVAAKTLFEALVGAASAFDRLCAAEDWSTGERLKAASALFHLSATNTDRVGMTQALTLIARSAPEAGEEFLELGARLLPLVATESLNAFRQWCLAFLGLLVDARGPEALASLVRALHDAGHLSLIDELRAGTTGARLPTSEGILVDATRALWNADYEAVLRFSKAETSDSLRMQIAAAIAQAWLKPTPENIGQLESLRSPPDDRWSRVPARVRAELLLRTGNMEQTAAAFREATGHPAMALLQKINDLRSPEADRKHVDPEAHQFVVTALENTGLVPPRDSTEGEEAHLWRLVSAFGGNRTSLITLAFADGLHVVDLPTSRELAISLQRALPRIGPDRVLESYRSLVDQYPELSAFRVYQAEVLLWLGQYEEALTLFVQAWKETKNRWAYVGHGAALAALRMDSEALSVWETGAAFHHSSLPGEATVAYRAEISLRRGGDFKGIESELRRGLSARPTRLRGWLILAEVLLRQNEQEEARQALLHAVSLCPGLFLRDGTYASMLAMLDSPEEFAAGRDRLVDNLSELRQRMRGNASSTMFTWFDRAGFAAFPSVSLPGMRSIAASIQRLSGTPQQEQIGASASPSDSKRLRFRKGGTAEPFHLEVALARAGRPAFVTVGGIALSYGGLKGPGPLPPALTALLGTAQSALASAANTSTVQAASEAIEGAAKGLGWEVLS